MPKVILSSTTAGPGGASTVTTEIELLDNVDIDVQTRVALDATKIAAETWQEWSRENETPEQREAREIAEKRQEQAREEMRRMLGEQG